MTTYLEELIEQGEKVLQDISSKFLLIEGKPLILPPAPNQQFFDQYGEKEITKDKKKKILMKQQLDYDAECLVYHQFERLDEEIIVLHNLAYSSKQIEFLDGKSVDGQHDFVVLVPGKAVIVLEVKNPLLKESENPFNTLKHAKKSATDQIKAFRCLLGELYAKTKEAPLEILGFPAFPKLDPSKLDPSKEIPSLKCNDFFSQQDLANFPLWWQKNVADRIGSENRPKKMRHMPETVHSLDKCQKILMGLWLTNFNLQASKPKNCFPIMLDRNEIMACTIRYIDSLLISQTIFSDLQKKSDILVKVEKTDKEYLSKAQCLKHIKYFTRDQVKLLETQSRILVNGPAGSGKTIIMYARILQLLAKTKAKDEKVLVLVPWNDAAEELKKIISNSTQPPKVIDLVKKLHETDCEPDLFFNILKGIEKHKVVIFSKPNFLLNSKLNKKYGHAKLREAHELFIDVLERENFHIFCDDFHNSIAHALISSNKELGSYNNPLQITDKRFSVAHFILNLMNNQDPDFKRMLWVGLDLIQIVQYAFWGTYGLYKEVPRCMKELLYEMQVHTKIVLLSGNLRNSYSIAMLLNELRGKFMKAIGYEDSLDRILPAQQFQHFIRGFTPCLYCVTGSHSFNRAADIVKNELQTLLRSLTVKCNHCEESQCKCISNCCTKDIAVIPVFSYDCYIKDSFEAYNNFKEKVQSIVNNSIPDGNRDDNHSIFIDNVKYANSMEFRFAILILDMSYPSDHEDNTKDEPEILLNLLSHLYLGVSRAKIWCSIILICSNDSPSALYSEICKLLDPYVKKISRR